MPNKKTLILTVIISAVIVGGGLSLWQKDQRDASLGKPMEYKEFIDTSISLKMQYPSYWVYSKNEWNGVFAYGFSLNDKDYAFTILPSGEFDHGFPFEEPTINNEEVLIGGKKAYKTVWKTSANAAFGIIKFTDLPLGWTKENRIEFAVPYHKLAEINQVLSSIQFF